MLLQRRLFTAYSQECNANRLTSLVGVFGGSDYPSFPSTTLAVTIRVMYSRMDILTLEHVLLVYFDGALLSRHKHIYVIASDAFLNSIKKYTQWSKDWGGHVLAMDGGISVLFLRPTGEWRKHVIRGGAVVVTQLAMIQHISVFAHPVFQSRSSRHKRGAYRS